MHRLPNPNLAYPNPELVRVTRKAGFMPDFEGTTYISAILDRSGSMGGQVDDTIGGYNAWLKDVKRASKGRDVAFTCLLFDDRLEYLYHDAAIRGAKQLTPKTYYARGTTALFDSLGGEILRLKRLVKPTDRAILLCMTDGIENASREIDHKRLADIVRGVDQLRNWSLTFIGANIDTFGVGRAMGMTLNSARINRSNDAYGTHAAFAASSGYVGQTVSGTRAIQDVPTQHEYDVLAAHARGEKPPIEKKHGRKPEDGKFTQTKPGKS